MRGRGTILKGDFLKYCTDFVPEQGERVLKTLILLDSFVFYGVLDEGASREVPARPALLYAGSEPGIYGFSSG